MDSMDAVDCNASTDGETLVVGSGSSCVPSVLVMAQFERIGIDLPNVAKVPNGSVKRRSG